MSSLCVKDTVFLDDLRPWADSGEGRGGGGAQPPLFPCIFKCFWNVNNTLLCITNTPTMLYAACPEK